MYTHVDTVGLYLPFRNIFPMNIDSQSVLAFGKVGLGRPEI